MSTKDKVFALVSEVLEVPRDAIHLETDFIEDLGTTSLDIVNLIWRIEDEFSLGETPESVLEGLRTVGQLVELVGSVRLAELSEIHESFDFVIASDHAGVALKAHLAAWLKDHHQSVHDLGPHEPGAVDYPSFAELVATQVATGDANFGILICGSGIGMSIAANKVDGVRAALVSEPLSAALSRKHNDANILCMGARTIGFDLAGACVEAFLNTPFDPGEDGRHRRRVKMIGDLES